MMQYLDTPNKNLRTYYITFKPKESAHVKPKPKESTKVNNGKLRLTSGYTEQPDNEWENIEAMETFDEMHYKHYYALIKEHTTGIYDKNGFSLFNMSDLH